MYKKLFASIVAAVMLITLLPCIGFGNEVAVYIDGEKVVFTSDSGSPFIENGRTLVPLRRTMEAFGAEVTWDGETRSIIVRKAPVTVLCAIDEMCVYRNGVKIPNDAAAVIRGGRTYLPIRVVLESFGAEVDWDGSVRITTKEGRFISEIENNGVKAATFWNNYNAANSAKAEGNYQKAVAEYRNAARRFILDEQNQSKAMLFLNLGDCYSAMGQYENARMCYLREAYYWKLAGDLQSEIAANRRATLISSYTQVYVKTDNSEYSLRKQYGVPFEPSAGIFLGACVPINEISSFEEITGKEHGAYLQYMEYGASLSQVTEGIPKDKIIQIHLQPENGLSQVREDSYLINLAKDMENDSRGYMLRFAGEMNDTSNIYWYDADPSKFIEAFRTVANVFRKYAPSVPVIWAPNFYPEVNYADYYPGDEYVDYVGISSYKTFLGEVDPLGKGEDRSRWSNQLDTLYSLYGHEKPFIVAEGTAANTSLGMTVDKTDFAVYQLKDFYTYAPIRYPNLDGIFIFDNNDVNPNYNLRLSAKPQLLDTYREAIQNPVYLSDPAEKKDNLPVYYELGNSVEVEAKPAELCAYVVYPNDTIAYVVYRINGVDAGVSYGAPYTAAVDFTAYAGQTVEVRAMVFDVNESLVSESTMNVKVK